MAERVAGALAGRGLAWELPLVDDDSDDDTLDVAGRIARRLPLRIEVRRGKRPDLSQAVLWGYHARPLRLRRGDGRRPVASARAHPRSARGSTPADMVVGTRYAAGASTTGDWDLARVLNSRLATLQAVPLTASSDPMSGFFAVDRRALTVDRVTTADMMAVLLPLWTSKYVTARKVLHRISAVMKWAMAQGYRTDNPAGDALRRSRGGPRRCGTGGPCRTATSARLSRRCGAPRLGRASGWRSSSWC